MPRYFADTFENGVLSPDDEGAELRGPDDARRIALEAMADLARERVLNEDQGHIRIDIRDAARRIVYSVAMTLEGGWADMSDAGISSKTAIVRQFLLGIVQSCAARGEDVVSRLEQFRALQQAVTALAPGDANASEISREIVTEIDRLLDHERLGLEAPPAVPHADDR